MTEQKTTRKPRTTRATKTEATQEVVEKVEVVENTPTESTKIAPVKSTRKSLTSIDVNDLVPVVAMMDSIIFIADNTSAVYEWSNKGDVQYITYGELISMKGRQKRFIDEMWIYIDDEEVVNALNITSVYEKFNEIKSLEDYLAKFETNYDLKEALSPLPNSIKKALGRQAQQMIEEEKLDKVSTTKALEECLGVELLDLLK